MQSLTDVLAFIIGSLALPHHIEFSGSVVTVYHQMVGFSRVRRVSRLSTVRRVRVRIRFIVRIKVRFGFSAAKV